MRAKILNIDYFENNVLINVLGSLENININDLFEIKKLKRKRTIDQNSLYWLFCDYVGMNLGMSKDEIHLGFSSRLLLFEKEINGKKFKTIKSTTDLNTKEFNNYLDQCNLIALEFAVDTSGFWEEYEKYKK